MSEQVPEEWSYAELQTVAKDYKGSIVDGPFGSNLKTSDYVTSGIPVLQGKNVTNDKFIWSDVRFITPEKANQLSRSSVRVGDILMVKIGSVGYSAIVDELNGFDYAIIPANLIKIDINSSKAVTKYVHHYLTSPEGKKRIIDEASSTAQPALSLGTMKKFKLPIPPLPEQKKIASILTSVDEVIETTQRQIDKLQDLKKATMNELLTKGIGHTEFKDSELGRIPKSWDAVGLETEIGIKHGYAFEGRFFSSTPNGVILLTPGNFNRDGSLYFGNKTKYFTGKVPEEYILKNGDLLVVMTDLTKEMTILGNAITLNSKSIVLHNQRIGKVDFKKQNLVSDFLRLVLNSVHVKKHVKDTATGTTVKHTSPSKILEVLIPIPPPEEQKRIVGVVSSIDQRIENVKRKARTVEVLKKSLMQDLLTGKVRVKVN